MSEAELASLSALKGSYAPYEILQGLRSPEGDFAPFSVIDKDQRVAVTDTTQPPARAIVQIEFFKGGASYGCTGAMIAADIVLTAGAAADSHLFDFGASGSIAAWGTRPDGLRCRPGRADHAS